ncbi:hypothetical protein KL944_002173 [Ogataea haglerorum]|nr:hypothetical protein KL944_002173 [Ogataea haglerorum]
MSITDGAVLKRARRYLAANRRLVAVVVVLLYWVVQNVWTWSPGARDLAQVDAKIEAELSSNLHTFGAHLRHMNRLPAESATLREKLTFYFPYYREKPVPNQIWQTWKVDLDDDDFPKQYRRFQKTWVQKNPDYVYHLIPDAVIEDFVASLYANVPEVVRAYQLLPKNIMKADFFRYLVIYARGGTYSDMDTVCLKPIKDWATFDRALVHAADVNADLSGIDPDARTTPVGLVIGIEADPDRPDWHEWFSRRLQFCQWTIQAKPGHPLLRELIIRIVEETFRKQHMGVLKRVEGKDSGADIMQWTGPGIFTDTLFDYLNNVASDGKLGDGYGVGSLYWRKHGKYRLKKTEINKNNEPLHSEDQLINWRSLTNIDKPKIIGDVMVLPITSFSPNVGHMGSKSSSDRLAFVEHLFSGSWKPKNK